MVCPGHEKQVDPITKKHFCYRKYVEDVKQAEKHALDLLESMTRPPGLVKEELQPILFKMIKIWSKIQTIRASTFLIPEIQSFPAGGQCQPCRQ